MFSKKSMHITLAFVLLIALASLGLAYGAWTDSLTINGTVTTGTFDVRFVVQGFDDSNCSLVESDAGDAITITASNLTPGDWCWTQIELWNNGSVPAMLESVVISKTGEDYWFTDFGVGAGTILLPGSIGGEMLLQAEIPADNSSQGKSASITVTVNAVQAP